MGLAAVALAAAGCEAQKSENPLSPNVAGPIAGVAITAPAPVTPSNGSEVLNTEVLRLVFNNASSNGVRPLWYVVEVAADSGFNSKVYTNGRVTPAEGTRTTVVVDSKLNAEATYFWRVRAEDGANGSEYSPVAHFDLVVPLVITAPTPVSPVNAQTTSTRNPNLTVNNGAIAGRVGDVQYRFQVATDQAFTNIVAQVAGARGNGTTTVTPPELPANTLLFWRAYGSNGTVDGPVSGTQSFRTPAAAPAPGPGGGGGGGGVPPPPAGGGRTPDPAPGQRLPLPNMSAVVQQVASQFPGALQNSCQEHGGSWEFMDRVVNELRKYDTRWGYNWKRANVGDPSLDVVNYHYGRGQDEGSREVYTIDIIVGHCGSSPGAAWIDLTDPNGAGAMWTGRGRF